MRLLVSGTRHEDPYIRIKVWDELESVYRTYGAHLFLILGGAKGVDTYAEEWAKHRKVDHVVLYAKWDDYGRSAGPIRNREMLRQEPDKALVFPAPDSKGTVDMVKRLNKIGIKPRKVSVSIP